MKRKSKSVYAIIGYLLIIIGIAMPLYGFFNISYRNLSENKKYRDYKKEELISDEEKKGVISYNENINGNYIVDPFTSEEYSTEYEFYKKNPDKIFAYLEIPKLDIKKPIYLDASYEHLDMGVAHIDGTSLPVGGVNKRSVIAGHRGWYRDLMFFNLHKLEAGDKVFIVRGDETLEYKVTDTEVILPSDWDALQPRENKDMITLLTCEPLRPPRPKRLLVNCERVSDVKEDVKSKDESVDRSVKRLDIAIYAITFVLMSLFVLAIYKFIRYLKQ